MLFYIICSAFLGLIILKEMILEKKPEFETYYKKVEPYQDWIGVGALALGVVALLDALLFSIGALFHAPIWWLVVLATSLAYIAAGLLLGTEKIKSMINEENFKSKLDLLSSKVQPHKQNVGFACAGLAVLELLALIF